MPNGVPNHQGRYASLPPGASEYIFRHCPFRGICPSLIFHLPHFTILSDSIIFTPVLEEIRKQDIELNYNDFDFSMVEAGEKITGQDKAMGLLRIGLSIERPGYNIFLSGDEGSGKLTALRQEISLIENDVSFLSDSAYLFNAGHPARPLSVLFKKGQARSFQADLDSLRQQKTSREELISKWGDDARLRKFIQTLPPYEENPAAWKINIVLDRGGSERRPLVIETHPSRASLFGFIEKDEEEPHLAVRIGSYQEAAGGFLVLSAGEIIGNDELWLTLKRYLDMTMRALASTAVQGEMMSSIRPQPIRMLTKVILMGPEELYDKIASSDETFFRYFKVSPEFDYSMAADRKNINGTVSYLKKAGEKMLERDDSAYREILRHSSFIAEDRTRLTTQLSILGDLLEEAELDAVSKGSRIIRGENVRSALKKREFFSSIEEEHINSEIRSGTMVMSLKGEKTGVVNALAVMDRALTSFGTPCVISATVAPGTEGIVNIEHEAGLSGNIHDKGLLILEGYLRHMYAQDFPLSLYAGICFEQSYGSIDGDSASSAELYALLSAIGRFPVRQDIAVTGSVNQMGELQPVGGINEKIQGFFNACSTLGLTGTQGVIIPFQNKTSLILPYEIEDAIEKGVFHVWTISSIDEGLELLSGLKMGERDRKGNYVQGSINRMIEDELKSLCRASQSFK